MDHVDTLPSRSYIELPMEDFPLWCMFFSSVVSFQFHPGTKTRLSVEECAFVADAMYVESLKRKE